MIDEETIHKEQFRKLEDLTSKLSGSPGVPGCTQYDVNNSGIAFGFACFNDDNVSVQRAVMSKGTVFPEHTHDVNEWLIVYTGSIKVTVDGQSTILNRADGVLIPAQTPHHVDTLEDTWLLGISVPPDPGYPK